MNLIASFAGYYFRIQSEWNKFQPPSASNNQRLLEQLANLPGWEITGSKIVNTAWFGAAQ